jgi:large subunit ribosomal protein L32
MNTQPTGLVFFVQCSIVLSMTVRMRHTPSHSKNRRSHHGLKTPNVISCTKCKTDVLPHMICVNCGYYKGKEEINVLKKLTKKEKKQKEKELAEQESAKGGT